jgi:hypothetical protein
MLSKFRLIKILKLEYAYHQIYRNPAVVVATADKFLRVFDITSGNFQPLGEPMKSPFAYQTRSVSIFEDR